MNWRHGLAQTRANWRRLMGAAVAIALGAAFVTTTFLTTAMVREAADTLVTAAVGTADAVAFPNVMDPAEIDPSTIPAATSANTLYGLDVVVQTETGIRTSYAGNVPDPSMSTLTSGSLPDADDEIAVPDVLADQIGARVGDTITIDSLTTMQDRPTPAGFPMEVTVSGIVASSNNQMLIGTPVVMTVDGLKELASQAGRTASIMAVFLKSDDLRALEREVVDSGWAADILTRSEMADSMLGGYTGTTSTITNFSIAFVAIALVVSALVVTTTFQVLIAQRVAMLGLLRTAGATRRQIAGSVLIEALALGVAGGLAGVLLGHLLAAVLVLIARRVELPVDWASSLPFAPEAIVLPLLVAIGVTLVSVIRPAIEASRIRPLAAVRAATSPRPSRVPIAFGVVLLVIGAASAAAISLLARSLQVDMGYMGDTTAMLLALGIAMISMIAGVTMITPAVFPRMNDFLGHVATALSPRKQRPTARLARRALATNRRRAIGTSNALLIGVTLVAMLGTGAATARSALLTIADGLMPTDVVVEAWSPELGSIPAEIVDQLRDIPGVAAVAPMASTYVTATQGQVSFEVTLVGADPEEFAAASYDPVLAEAIAPGVLVVGPTTPLTSDREVTVASTIWPVNVSDPNAPVTPEYGDPVALTARVISVDQWEAFTTLEDFDRVFPDAPISRVWISAPGADLDQVMREVERIALITDEYGNPISAVYAPGKDRAVTVQNISSAVTLATSLLAISILIALLGVANTLSLSVVERRREFAMLRSVGMTARQVRNSLALEGLVMALSAALVGIVLGIGFGLAGSSVLFPDGTNHLQVPWALMLGIVAVACVAGPLAAIIPGRLATRGSPMAALSS